MAAGTAGFRGIPPTGSPPPGAGRPRAPPRAGPPFFEPCLDDKGKTLFAVAGAGQWFSATPGGFVNLGTSPFNATSPRVYKGANVQIDAVFNKKGYHYSQQRIISLWEDVASFISK